MRRKAGAILPLEQAVLDAIGDGETHGFEIAKRLQTGDGQVNLATRGTIYKALSRLVRMGLLTRRWDDTDNGPRRRLYRAAQSRAVAEGKG